MGQRRRLNRTTAALITVNHSTMTPEELEAKVSELEAKNAVLTSALETSENKLREALSKGSIKIESEKTAAVEMPKDPFVVKGKKYRFKVPAFRIGGEKHLASDASVNAELCAKIVEEYASLVEAV